MKKRHLFALILILIVPMLTMARIWDDLIKNEQAAITCRYEQKQLLQQCNTAPQISYDKEDLPLPDYQKHLVWVGLSLSFFILGAYFFWEFLKILGITSRKVSFVSHVSHELKTPLTNLRLYIDLLKNQTAEQPETQKKLAVLDQECLRLTQLVDNLLFFSGGDRLHITLKDQDIDEIIESLRVRHADAFAAKNLKLMTESHRVRATVDRSVLEQILVNLLSNALKYVPAGGTIKLSARKEDKKLLIRVEDDGPGIPAALRKKIFVPFERGDGSNTQEAAGMGIGLPLARNLAQAHGGELVLLETPKGAAFEVRL